MKRFLRILFIFFLLTASAGMLFWYYFIRRVVPEHAKYIPKNAIAVVTLNTRALAIDRASGGHLYPEFEKISPIPGSITRLIKAAERNGGSGIRRSADILAFFWMKDHSAFGTICVAMDDSAVFGKLMRNEIPKELNTWNIFASNNGRKLIGFSGKQPVVAGWNADAAVFTFAISDDDSTSIADATSYILSGTENNSILKTTEFTDHELSSFDIGAWINADQFLHFTGGGKYFRNALSGMKYIALSMDFNKGEIAVRRTIHYSNANAPVAILPKLCSDEKGVTGFTQHILHLASSDELKNSSGVFPMSALPFSDTRWSSLATFLDPQCTVIYHDTFPSYSEYISYEYDDNFNQVEVKKRSATTQLGMTYIFPLKKITAAQEMIGNWMKEDSVLFTNGCYTIETNNGQWRMFFTDNSLIYTNWQGTDGKDRPIPAAWSGMQFSVDPRPWLRSEDAQALSFILPDPALARDLAAKEMVGVALTQEILIGAKGTSEFRLYFRNEKVNALIQLSEMGRKLVNVED